MVASYRSIEDFISRAYRALSSPEVSKLDARVALFDVHCQRRNHRLELTCRSPESCTHLAEGLISACGKYFGEDFAIARQSEIDTSGTVVHFAVTSCEIVSVA